VSHLSFLASLAACTYFADQLDLPWVGFVFTSLLAMVSLGSLLPPVRK